MTTPTQDPKFAFEAIEQVLTEQLGSYRTIPSGSLANWGAFEGDDPSRVASNALITAQITLTPGATIEGSPGLPIHAPVRHLKPEYSVKVSYHVRDPGLFSSPTHKRAVFDAMETDAESIRKALTYPGNLDTTVSGSATGLASGCLQYAGRSTPTVDIGSRLAQLTINFRGHMFVSQ